ncbi:hypothetical protein GQ53DRAFT_820966 [Thozetella sp. PMI_491]|nr:hypothetical protein GQ53DRAFT_820966 [Thozetella sp. PMI_491]
MSLPQYGLAPTQAEIDQYSDMEYGITAQEETALMAEALRWVPKRPAIGQRPAYTLQEKPVVIPRIDTVGKLQAQLPFMRAYSPSLAAYGIGPQDFVAFIDNLALAQAPPPALKALNLASTGLRFVPLHTVQLVAAGVSVATGVGTAVATKARTKKFMETVNREFFEPRGLKATMYKNSELIARLGLNTSMPPLTPLDRSSKYTSVRDRRMQALAPYVSPLSLDVPPPAPQRSVLDRISAKQIQHTIDKKEKKERKKQSASQSDSESDSDNSLDEKLRKLDERVRKIDMKAEKDLASKGPSKAYKVEEKRREELQKVEEDRQKVEGKGERRPRKVDKKKDKKVNKELKQVEKMEYLVIESLW